MGMKHIPDGQDFSAEHFPKDFGFTGSARTERQHSSRSPQFEDEPEGLGASTEGENRFSDGGHIHPHGHRVVRTEHREDGAIEMHHAHGGMSIMHADGHMTHHTADGHVMAEGGMEHMAHGGGTHTHPEGHRVTHVEPHGDGEIHHHEHGGYTKHHGDGRITHHRADGAPVGMAADMARDRKMIAKGIHEHEDQEHRGEHSKLELARGGMPGRRPRLPRGMNPKVKSAHPLGEESALNRAPADPARTVTPRNSMPGGQMGYGVEPSAEPDVAGSDMSGGMPGMKRGGMRPDRKRG